jgi:hypothetical protein
METFQKQVIGRFLLCTWLWGMAFVFIVSGISFAQSVCDFVEPNGLRIRAYVPPLVTSEQFPIIGEGGEFPGQEVAQQWRIIDKSRTVRLIRGHVSRAKHNFGGEFDDGDWNIDIQPNPIFHDVLVNSKGNENSQVSAVIQHGPGGIPTISWQKTLANKIEGEIHSAFPSDGLDLKGLFDNKDIAACGWWVEDLGHSVFDAVQASNTDWAGDEGGKTELHPLVYMKRDDGPGAFTLFAAQDTALNYDVYLCCVSRFPIADVPMYISMDIPMSVTPGLVNISNDRQTRSKPSLVRQTITLDYVRASWRFGNVVSENTLEHFRSGQSAFIHVLSSGSVWQSVTFQGAGGGGSASGIDPLLLTQVTTESPNLHSYRYETRKKRTSNGKGYLEVTVSSYVVAPLQTTGYGQVQFDYYNCESSSTYPYFNCRPMTQGVTTESDYPHREFHLVYAPLLGAYVTEWPMAVRASTRSRDWNPGLRQSYDGPSLKQAKVAYYYDALNFRLEPTSVVLRASSLQEVHLPKTRLKSVLDANDRTNLPDSKSLILTKKDLLLDDDMLFSQQDLYLEQGLLVRSALKKVHPSVQMAWGKWLVQLDGSQQVVAVGQTIEFPGFSATAVSADVLKIVWHYERPIQPNFTVWYAGETDVNESINQSITLARPNLASGAIKGNGSFFVLLRGGALKISPQDVRLGLAGELMIEVLGADKRSNIRLLAEAIRKRPLMPLEPYKLQRQLTSQGKEAQLAYVCLIKGENLTAKQSTVLAEVAQLGADIRKELKVKQNIKIPQRSGGSGVEVKP